MWGVRLCACARVRVCVWACACVRHAGPGRWDGYIVLALAALVLIDVSVLLSHFRRDEVASLRLLAAEVIWVPPLCGCARHVVIFCSVLFACSDSTASLTFCFPFFLLRSAYFYMFVQFVWPDAWITVLLPGYPPSLSCYCLFIPLP